MANFIYHPELAINISSSSTGLGRVYTLDDGTQYPSVTTITGFKDDGSLDKWRKRVGEENAKRIARAAANRGEILHSQCEAFLKDELPEFQTPIDEDLFLSIRPLLEKINNIHALEVPLYSRFLEVAGRVDCIGEFMGELAVVDFKTSTKSKKRDWISGYFQQTAAYSVCFEELTKIPVKKLVIIIAIPAETPQIYIESRNTWINSFIDLRQEYKKINKF